MLGLKPKSEEQIINNTKRAIKNKKKLEIFIYIILIIYSVVLYFFIQLSDQLIELYSDINEMSENVKLGLKLGISLGFIFGLFLTHFVSLFNLLFDDKKDELLIKYYESNQKNR